MEENRVGYPLAVYKNFKLSVLLCFAFLTSIFAQEKAPRRYHM